MLINAGQFNARVVTSLFLLEPISVNLHVFLPFRRQIFAWENGSHGTFVHAQTAVNASFWINVQLRGVGECCGALHRMNAIHGTDFDARSVFSCNTRFSDHMGHIYFLFTFQACGAGL